MTVMEQAIQIGMTSKRQHVRSSFSRRHGQESLPVPDREMGTANALMMAGMVIFLGWLAGGRASAILQL
jgi:hypothetical protein